MYASRPPNQERHGTNEPTQGFYDPGNDKLIEPKHTGISYSFSEDGHYESAYYRAIANRMSFVASAQLARL